MNSRVESTMNGTNEEKIKEEIIGVLLESQHALSTNDICLKLERAWHSIQTNCLRLQIEGRIEGFRSGRLNLWQLLRNGGQNGY